MKRVALYVRVSTEEQRKYGISVDAQIFQLTEYAKSHNYSIVGVYNDAGISARKPYKKRPALLNLIQDCKDKKVDLILITKLDRFFRSVSDYYSVMEQIGNVPWKSIHEDYETETSSGVFKVNIMLSVAQSEADRTSERIKSVFEYKKAQGDYVKGYKLPIGYILKDNKLYFDPEQEQGVKVFFESYIIYHSIFKAIDEAAKHGVIINTPSAYHMLNSPVFMGDEPYVVDKYLNKDQQLQILKLKGSHIKHKRDNAEHLFSGLCRCSLCGHTCVSKTNYYKRKSDNIETSITRYICSYHRTNLGCTGTSISEKILEQYLINSIESEIDIYNSSISLSTIEDNEKKIKALKARQKRLKDLYELGDIAFDEYKNKRMSIIEELTELEKIPEQRIKTLPSDWLSMYVNLDIAHKRAFWEGIINYVSLDKMRCEKPIIVFK